MQVRNPVSCWKLFEETGRILGEAVGPSNMPPLPPHPDDLMWQHRQRQGGKGQAQAQKGQGGTGAAGVGMTGGGLPQGAPITVS